MRMWRRTLGDGSEVGGSLGAGELRGLVVMLLWSPLVLPVSESEAFRVVCLREGPRWLRGGEI